MRRFDQVVVAADGQRLRVGEGLLEARGEFVHAHREYLWKGVAGVPAMLSRCGLAAVFQGERLSRDDASRSIHFPRGTIPAASEGEGKFAYGALGFCNDSSPSSTASAT